MPESLANIDPAWAWQEFTPSAERPWNRGLAMHLLRRAGFGATAGELSAVAAKSPREAIEGLFQAEPNADFDRELDQLAQTLLATGKPEHLSACWLYRLLRTPQPLLEKMTLFWHGHFATSAEKVQNGQLMLNQNRLLRSQALGRFDLLVHEVARDPAMLVYLDSATNRKAHPNENFARELMELFCLGLGQYTERDVQQLARCFTGWEVLRGGFKFNAGQHDNGQKTLLGKSGPFSGEEGVNLVLAQPSTAQFIVGKLFRWFICDEPDPAPELLAPLAQEFQQSGYHIAPLVKRMLASNLFFSPHAVARKIRSPVELAITLLRTLEASTNVNLLAVDLAEQGQALFFPPSVKGWDGGRNWVNSATVLASSNMVGRLMRSGGARFASGGLEALAAKHDCRDLAASLAWLAELLLAVPLDEARRTAVLEAAQAQPPAERHAALVQALSLLPEFQLN